jgi:hypothetical protein
VGRAIIVGAQNQYAALGESQHGRILANPSTEPGKLEY